MNHQRIITVLHSAYRNYMRTRNTPKPLGRWNTLDNSMIKADLATMDSCCCNSASKLIKTKSFGKHVDIKSSLGINNTDNSYLNTS